MTNWFCIASALLNGCAAIVFASQGKMSHATVWACYCIANVALAIAGGKP